MTRVGQDLRAISYSTAPSVVPLEREANTTFDHVKRPDSTFRRTRPEFNQGTWINPRLREPLFKNDAAFTIDRLDKT